MQINTKGKNKGFVLIVVMLFTMMASTVVLTSLKDSTVQERLSGNFQKKMNARMIAEKGVYDAYNAMNATLQLTGDDAVDNTADIIDAAFGESGTLNGEYSLTVSDADGHDVTYDVLITDLGDNLISVSSVGSDYEGQNGLSAIYELVTSTGTSEAIDYGTGITGCDSVSLSGSGSIDSYDSSLGEYDEETNSDDNAIVKTIYSDSGDVDSTGADTYVGGDVYATGDVTYTGTSEITGNVQANGSISLIGVPVGGYITARETITLSDSRGSVVGYLQSVGDISLDQMNVGGNVSTHGNFDQLGVTGDIGIISGNVLVVGDVALTNASNIELMGEDALIYGGTNPDGLAVNYVDESSALTAEEIALEIGDVPIVSFESLTDTESSTATCDMYDIVSQVSTVDPGDDVELPDLYVSNWGTDHYNMGFSSAIFTVNSDTTNNSPSDMITSTAVTFMGESYQILMYEDFRMTGGQVTIEEGEDVTIYVRGDFLIDGTSTITIPDSSSLTVIIQGSFVVDGSAEIITPVNGLTEDNRPVFSIYSSYDSRTDNTWGLEFKGGQESIYAVIYAPYTNVSIASDVDFMGSIYGNAVSLSGNGDFHYDENLANVNYGGGTDDDSGSTRLVFVGWAYSDGTMVETDDSESDAESESDADSE